MYVASFSEPNTKTQDFHALINWGDGSRTTPGHIHGRGNGQYAVIGSHRYISHQVFPVTVTIRDPAGFKEVAKSTAHVVIPAKK